MRSLNESLVVQFIVAAFLRKSRQHFWVGSMLHESKDSRLSLLGYENFVIGRPREQAEHDGLHQIYVLFAELVFFLDLVISKQLMAKLQCIFAHV